MDKKIVFFDIDGTIYKYSTGMQKDSVEAIKKLKANGHIPVLCTGRSRVMIYDEFLEPGFEDIICGAGTCLEIKGRTVYLEEMENEDIFDIINSFIKYGFSPIAEGYSKLYLEKDSSRLNARAKKIIGTYRANLKDLCEDITEGNAIHASKVSGAFLDNADKNKMLELYSDKYNIIDHEGKLLEIIPKDYSKATGIKKLLEYYGIPWENTYAFGDSMNDLEMLKCVKYGICMGNSDPSLFEHTEYRTDDYDKGGIVNALTRFGLIDAE